MTFKVDGANGLTFPNSSTQTIGGLTTLNPQSGGVVQVVSVSKTNQFTSSTTVTWTDVTGLAATITPKFSTSSILVMVTIGTARGGDNSALRLVRASTPIQIGDANPTYPSDTRATVADLNTSNANGLPVAFNYLDSPATTSSTTYKVQFWLNSGSFYLNSGAQYTDNAAYRFFTASSITLMEIAA
jgi:hypothetical protein